MSLQKKKSRVQELREQLAEAEEDLLAAQRVREVEPLPGSKVYITARFPGSSKVYEYLAVRTKDRDLRSWYITGRAGAQTWDEIMDRIDRADIEIRKVAFI